MKCTDGRWHDMVWRRDREEIPERSSDIMPDSMSNDSIVIKGASEHNLKHIDLTLPRTRSWSLPACRVGEVLARFDTLYRRSAPLRRVSFRLRAPVPRGRWKARLELIEGLSPPSRSSRSDLAQPALDVGT